jgi:hypothetical protein
MTTPIQTKSMICSILMALLAGCVEMVVPGQLDALKSGAIQPLGDYKSAIQSYLHDNLRDSMSAVLEYAQPVRDVHLDKPVAGVSHFIACWRVDVNVNAKNAFGGYVGFQRYSFWFDRDRMIASR